MFPYSLTCEKEEGPDPRGVVTTRKRTKSSKLGYICRVGIREDGFFERKGSSNRGGDLYAFSIELPR